VNWIDWIALLFGVLGVILTIFETIWCWPLSLISVIIQAFAFYNARLFGDFSLQIFYFFSGIYGWMYWNKNKVKPFEVSNTPKKIWLFIIISEVVLAFIIYIILSHFKSDQIILDSILTAASLICTYLMTKKWVENWLLWIVIDLTYVYLYINKQLPIYAILYLFFSIMACYGFYTWRKKIKKLPF
jgi:nicotinamide mononucleotide transporter